MMEIVCCPDKNYIMPCGVMIKSLCENNKDCEIRIHVIVDNDVNDNHKKSLTKIIEPYEYKSIIFYNMDKIQMIDFPALNKNTHIKRSTYFRLYLTEILPHDINKILYLDADLIIEKNLSVLWNYDIEKYAIGWCLEHETDNISQYNRLQYPRNKCYYNAGVSLINLTYWRKHNLLEKFTKFMTQHYNRIKYHDQDVMNCVLIDCCLRLPLKFNVQPGFFYKKDLILMDLQKYGEEIEEAKKDPFILHFSTRYKPWNEDCSHPLKSTFFKYQDMTEWKNIPLVEEFIPNRPLKAILGDFLRLIRIKKPIKRINSRHFFDT